MLRETLLTIGALALVSSPVLGQEPQFVLPSPPAQPQGSAIDPAVDLDAFMDKVTENVAANWDLMYDFVFRQAGTVDVRLDGEHAPLFGRFFKTGPFEAVWFVQDGRLAADYVVRGGKTVSKRERDRNIAAIKKYEEKGVYTPIGERRDKYFTLFSRDRRRSEYRLVGQEDREGREVAVIEFDALWDAERETDSAGTAAPGILPSDALVSILVDTKAYQLLEIVARRDYRVDGPTVPGDDRAWLIDRMAFHEPFAGVWLPSASTFIGESAACEPLSQSLSYRLESEYYDYRRAGVDAQVTFGRPSIEELRGLRRSKR